MLHNHIARTKTRTRSTIVAAAVSAAIIGAVAIGEPWNPANAAAGTSADAGTNIGAGVPMAAVHGGFADLVSTVRPAVVNVEVTRAIRPRRPVARMAAATGNGAPGVLPALPADALEWSARRAEGRGRRLRVHHRCLGARRHQPARGEGGRIR